MAGKKLSFFNLVAAIDSNHRLPLFIDNVSNEKISAQDFVDFILNTARILGVNDIIHNYELWDQLHNLSIDWDNRTLNVWDGLNNSPTINWQSRELLDANTTVASWGASNATTTQPYLKLEGSTSIHLDDTGFVNIESIPTIDNPFLCIPIYNVTTNKRYFIQLREEE